MTDVIVFNAGGRQVLHRVTLKHAISMLYRNVARVRDEVPGERFGPYPRPRSLELVNYVYTRWVYQATGRLPCTLTNVLRRDRFRCAYCAGPAGTRDHVVPRSRGGGASFTIAIDATIPLPSSEYGTEPVISSYSNTPSEYTSVLTSTSS